ncbi:helix-turn-helix transcriptional regulator [Streptomyces sp. NPDC046881]|uniref:helix-turn-helix domain-containing protein n=1 Tax=Streptomyces sp. NPDC046881 TaxID=3155374 RepID=UPI0033F41265
MRSKGSPERTEAAALGALVERLAAKAGYDLTPWSKGRARLAEDSGMSVWSIGRLLRGETLPRIENLYGLAAALKVDEDLLLDTAGYPKRSDRAKVANQPVLSVANPPPPEEVADVLGITHPFVRKMLISSIVEAQRLQRESDQHDDGQAGGAAVAR